MLLLGTLAVVVTAYAARQLYLLYQASFKVVGAQIGTLSTKSIKIVLDVELDNAGDISATVSNQHYDIYLNNIQVSTIDSADIIHINSNGATIIPINIDLAPDKILKIGTQNLADLLTDRSKIVLDIIGYLSVKTGPVSLKNYPISVKYTLQQLIDMAKS